MKAGEVLARQADGVSCGPTVLLVTAALAEGATPVDVPAAAQRAAHRQANRVWPRFLGTTPWGMRAWLRRHAPAAGRFRIRRWSARTARAVTAAVAAGNPVPLLVGARIPRHWVLVLGLDGGAWLVFEPSSGQVRRLDPAVLLRGDAAGVVGWPRAFCALLG
ncbi:hypothetical protein [Pseudonocardia phyllosphaerae]|uniref:hypothetical protein n=1 Tax=Pseudonocardia phyllosphaerae TaxID=3390502 RepID=UPI00397A517B